MKRIIGVIFLTILIASSVSPRQQNSPPGKDSRPDFEGVKERLLNPQPVADIRPSVSMATSLAASNDNKAVKSSRQNRQSVIELPEYVFKDGAFYMVLHGSNVLIPMIGGGASGCFAKDLDQRERALKGYVKKLPRRF